MKVSGLLIVIVPCMVGMMVCQDFFPPPPPPRPTNDGLFGLAALFGGTIPFTDKQLLHLTRCFKFYTIVVLLHIERIHTFAKMFTNSSAADLLSVRNG